MHYLAHVTGTMAFVIHKRVQPMVYRYPQGQLKFESEINSVGARKPKVVNGAKGFGYVRGA